MDPDRYTLPTSPRCKYKLLFFWKTQAQKSNRFYLSNQTFISYNKSVSFTHPTDVVSKPREALGIEFGNSTTLAQLIASECLRSEPEKKKNTGKRSFKIV